MADLAVWQRTIVDEEGNVIPGAEIEVRREEDDSLATLYADRAGETPLANPLAADMSGFVRFFAQGDAYTITAVGAGSTRTWRFDPTGRLQEFDRVSEALVADDAADLLSARSNLGTFSSATEVQSHHIPAVLESIRTFGRNAPGDGPPLVLVRGSSVPGAVQSADGQWWEDVGHNSITVGIPTDFPTLQSAIQALNRLPMRAGATIDLVLESSYVMEDFVFFEGLDLGKFRILAEASEVPISASALLAYEQPDSRFMYAGAMQFINCTTPAIYPKFVLDAPAPGRSGLETICSQVIVRPGAGFCGPFYRNALFVSSLIEAPGSLWSDSLFRAVSVLRGSNANMEGADCRRAGGTGAGGSSPDRGMFASWASTVNFNGGLVDGSGGEGVAAFEASTVSFSGGSAKDVQAFALRATNSSKINGRDSTLSNVAGELVYIRAGSEINIVGADTTGPVSSHPSNAPTEEGIIYRDGGVFPDGSSSGNVDCEIGGTSETNATATVRWVRVGRIVSLTIDAFSVESDDPALYLDGLPSELGMFNSTGYVETSVINNGVAVQGQVNLNAAARILFRIDGNSTGFSSSGQKGIPWPIQLTYGLR